MKRFALLFPGQGAQEPGMGRELSERFNESRDIFRRADEALEESISEICFGGTAEQLALTENTQPALLTVSMAALEALRVAGLGKPAAAAGHSLGEYSAHVAAATLSFEDAVRAVRYRGRFMQEAVPVGVGSMAAIIGLDVALVEKLCVESADGEIVSMANMNSPGQVVIAGHAAAVSRVTEKAKESGARMAVPLPVSAPFHCSLMVPAARRLEPVLREIRFSDPDFPVYTNTDAAPVSGGPEAREALIRQVASPVRWIELMQAMAADGIELFLEVGHGKVLTGLAKRIDRRIRVIPVNDQASVQKAVQETGG